MFIRSSIVLVTLAKQKFQKDTSSVEKGQSRSDSRVWFTQFLGRIVALAFHLHLATRRRNTPRLGSQYIDRESAAESCVIVYLSTRIRCCLAYHLPVLSRLSTWTTCRATHSTEIVSLSTKHAQVRLVVCHEDDCLHQSCITYSHIQ